MRRFGRTHRFAVAAILLVGIVGILHAEEIHKNNFSGKSTSFIKGPDNVKAEEKAHELSADRARSLPTSEFIRLNTAPGKNEVNYAYYYYPTPAAPITEDLSAELWVHSNKAGVQMLARVVFPKERNPQQIDEPLTATVLLDTYKAPVGGWQKLVLRRPLDILQAQKQALRLEYKKDVDVSDAYIDRIILNLYAGGGMVEVYLDNLEIGPVKPGSAPPPPVTPKTNPISPMDPTAKSKDPPRLDRAIPVSFDRGKLMVGGQPAFPRFLRYTGTPFQVLRDAGFNSLYMDANTAAAVVDDAINNYSFWVIPYLQPIVGSKDEKGGYSPTARDVDEFSATIQKFHSLDAVLAWDLGSIRREDFDRVLRTVDGIRKADANRPIAADVWDDFDRYSQTLDLIGNHRDPLMTSLELNRYAEWLYQRKTLAKNGKFHWTWVQTHMPDWQAKVLYDKSISEGFSEPIGPQPEQIRLLTYLAIASGSRGLGFWSDRFLSDSFQGRDRLLQLAILNQEIEMLEPILLTSSGLVQWVDSSNKYVKVAILRSSKGVLAIPIWLGSGAQYVPPQAAVADLSFTIPQPPDGSQPYEISPARVQSLQPNSRFVAGGVQINLPEFDLTAAIVFTNDLAPDGLVAKWQRHTRRVGRHAAQWACDLADEELRKVSKTQEILQQVGPPLEVDPNYYLNESQKRLNNAKRARLAGNDETAYFEALRAMRPLRILMRAHWERAVKTLDTPTSSPYAVSFHTLPKHWELARQLRGALDAVNALNDGDFEAAKPTTREGVDVAQLPGWTVQAIAIDKVDMKAALVSSTFAKEERPARKIDPLKPWQPTSEMKRYEKPDLPLPNLGNTCLRLSISPQAVKLKKADDKPPPEPEALERTFLCVNSPAVRLQPDSWVRISGWIKVPQTIRASADGVLFYDTVAGEAFALRINDATEWKEFHLYRKVPSSGELRVRMALTGFGTVYFDDIKITPLIPGRDKKELPEPERLSRNSSRN